MVFGFLCLCILAVCRAEADVPALPSECDSRIWLSAMVVKWKAEVAAARASGREPSLWRVLFHLCKPALLVSASLRCVEVTLIYFASFALGWVVEYLNESASSFTTALGSVFALFVSTQGVRVPTQPLCQRVCSPRLRSPGHERSCSSAVTLLRCCYGTSGYECKLCLRLCVVPRNGPGDRALALDATVSMLNVGYGRSKVA
jgi:hypothetical protein